MAWRSVMIENPARLRIKHNQLVICTGEEHERPIEDIDCLLVEHPATVVSANVLSRLSLSGAVVLFCDEKHMPSSVLLPICGHSRKLRVLNMQLEASKPLKKRMWQSIVQRKIMNQAKCLLYNGRDNAKVTLLAEDVHSGDPENIEARAAAEYFKVLFVGRLVRGSEGGWNAALNYGYTLLRGYIARMLSVYGFEPCLGIFHRSEQNAFNLADDLIEPFRPVVDLYVSQNVGQDDELTTGTKRGLFSLLSCEILSGNEKHSMGYAMERLVKSLHSSLEDGQPELVLPELLPICLHSYE